MKYHDRELVLLTGKPGSGTLELGEELNKLRSVEHISFSTTVRKIACAAFSSLYEQDIRDHLAAHPLEPFPLDLAAEITHEMFERTDGTPTLVLEGFPQSLDQIDILKTLADRADRQVTGVIETTVDDEVALRQLVDGSERDISPDEARERLQRYHALHPAMHDALNKEFRLEAIEPDRSEERIGELGHTALEKLRLAA
jgi:adenylate kinase family enzyme